MTGHFLNVQIIFLSKEPAFKMVLPTSAKMTISLKVTIVSYSYSFKVSMVTYECYCPFGTYEVYIHPAIVKKSEL